VTPATLPAELSFGPPPALTHLLRFLAAEPNGNQVCEALLHGILAPTSPAALALFALNTQAKTLVAVGSAGVSQETLSYYATLPLSIDVPPVICITEGASSFVPLTELADRFPALAPLAASAVQMAADGELRVLLAEDPVDLENGHLVSLPLVFGGVPAGVLVGAFLPGWQTTWQEMAYVDGVLAALSMWMGTLLVRSDFRPLPLISADGPRLLELTERQQSVLELLREGRTVPQAARTLAYSVSTVKGDVADMMRMLGASTRADLLEKAERVGL
jgi:DNA-binding CsgD family transcriptional regulator